ncbi:MAG: ABC transporter ATP-binding protein [Phycisphaerae bacterium]
MTDDRINEGGTATAPGCRAEGRAACLAVHDLVVRFPARRDWFGRTTAWVEAVRGVSFTIERGRAMGLVGESGSGKTTVARAVLRLIAPAAGRVVFDGVDILSLEPSAMRKLRRRLQVVLQDPVGSLNPRLTIGRAIAEPMVVHGIARGAVCREGVAALLERVGLRAEHAGRYPHEFSGGQRQRIGIARALAVEPELIICDEPVSALDVSVQAQILNLLRDLQKDLGLTYLFIAHDLAVVRHFCDEVAVMYLGRIVEQAPAATLFERPSHPYTQALIAAVPRPETACEGRSALVSGEIPSPLDPPSGCAFHPRCPIAQRQCSQEVPLMRPLGEPGQGRRVACHLAE